ncbi:DUF928 domain-containing protein [Baaleninema sp.]|uniref:DUF928 domain-containing protein n=1 Tax=Baaleninema sp. TaxID=3101197 RepID=UPI003D07FEB0
MLLSSIAMASLMVSPETIAVDFEPPDRGSEGDREGSSSRTFCPAVNRPLLAIVPENSFGQTISPRPRFWFYVPYDEVRPLVFVLRDSRDRIVYETQLNHSGDAGFVEIALPETTTLDVGQPYYWRFSYRCNPALPAEDDLVYGTIERIAAPDNLQPPELGSPSIDRAGQYAAAHLWFDVLAELIRLQRQTPDDDSVDAEWRELLKSIGLEFLADEAIE